jgi:hypothetical protein
MPIVAATLATDVASIGLGICGAATCGRHVRQLTEEIRVIEILRSRAGCGSRVRLAALAAPAKVIAGPDFTARVDVTSTSSSQSFASADRNLIVRYRRVAGLHGHVHESGGAIRVPERVESRASRAGQRQMIAEVESEEE